MRGIALKIFLSFWLIFAVLIASFALLPNEGTDIRFRDHLHHHGAIAAPLLETGGLESCEAFAAAAADRSGLLFVVADRARQPLCPRSLAGAAPLQDLLRQRGNDLDRGGAVVAIDSPGAARFAAGVPLPRFAAQLSVPPFPYRGVAFAIVISGLVCFVVARYLARPLQLVRDTSYQLAAGNLQARAGPTVGHRRDEIGELVRDFDAMATRIEALVQAQNQLMADISHELRSPLARLNVALELARRKSAADLGPDLDRIELEAERMNDLIGRVLALARAENNQGATRAPLALAEIVARVTADAEYEAQRQRKSVALDLLAAPTVNGEPQLLISAFDNVLRNAIRYTPEGSVVDVTLDRTQTHAVLTVRDRGPGVPNAELERMFASFQRIGPAREAETGGVGLGLAIARRTIGVHNGTIEAENAPDGGLRVTIRLPLHKSPSDAEDE